jgi:hypothetical protein
MTFFALAFAAVLAFLVVIPQGSASSFAVAVAPAFALAPAIGPSFSPDIPPLFQPRASAPGTLPIEPAA